MITDRSLIFGMPTYACTYKRSILDGKSVCRNVEWPWEVGSVGLHQLSVSVDMSHREFKMCKWESGKIPSIVVIPCHTTNAISYIEFQTLKPFLWTSSKSCRKIGKEWRISLSSSPQSPRLSNKSFPWLLRILSPAYLYPKPTKPLVSPIYWKDAGGSATLSPLVYPRVLAMIRLQKSSPTWTPEYSVSSETAPLQLISPDPSSSFSFREFLVFFGD